MSSRKKRPDVTVRTKTAAARSPAERLEPGRAPSRPRGLEAREPSRFVSGFVRFFSGLLTVSLVGMLTLSGIGLAVYHQYEAPGPLDAPRMIVVPKGEGRREIAERLEREGIITNRWTFIGGLLVQSMLGKKVQDLKAGEFEIDAHASMREVTETIASGKSVMYKVTVPEGLTSKQIVERLKGEENLTGEISVLPREGSLLPDTYQFSKGTSRQEIIETMQGAMQRMIAKHWDARSAELPLRTVEEAITFASIVEKETGQADERERVAAVFYNRLKKGMRLQSDPTIIYGINAGAGPLGRGITKADIETKTAYNTYQINGLPPGPIANPGKAALEATFKPAKTNDLYFVADGTGGHAFSETLKDHNSAVQKWRQVEKKAKADAQAADAAGDDLQPNPDVTPIPEQAEPPPAAPAAKSTPAKTAAPKAPDAKPAATDKKPAQKQAAPAKPAAAPSTVTTQTKTTPAPAATP